MQSQENIHNIPENQRNINMDPREQTQEQEYTQRSYAEGYGGLEAGEIWRENDKLRPETRTFSAPGPSLVLVLVVLVCAVFIVGSVLGIILSWLSWVIVTVLIVASLTALATNWHVVTIPMPTRTFQIMEHARLTLSSYSGPVTIRRGEPGVVTVNATKRTSGIGTNPEHIYVSTEQQGDTVNVSARADWNFFQFGLRSVNFEITVPPTCDIQLNTGSGQVSLQGTSGNIRARSGSGGIEANNLQGQIELKTGSGSIQGDNLQGTAQLQTGSGRITLYEIKGPVTAKTGSGRIEIGRGSLARASRISTGSGSIDFEGTIDPRSNIDMHTGSGGIQLRLPANSAFILDARTGSGGVQNEFGNRETGDGPRALLKLRTGSGGIRVYNTGEYNTIQPSE